MGDKGPEREAPGQTWQPGYAGGGLRVALVRARRGKIRRCFSAMAQMRTHTHEKLCGSVALRVAVRDKFHLCYLL
jgi:hypothetical protein